MDLEPEAHADLGVGVEDGLARVLLLPEAGLKCHPRILQRAVNPHAAEVEDVHALPHVAFLHLDALRLK